MRGDTKEARLKRKEYADKRWQAKEKKVKEGDEVLLKREKSTTKSPWDPKPFKVVQVEGSRVTARRGEEKKARAKNHVKVVKVRPDYLRVEETFTEACETQAGTGLPSLCQAEAKIPGKQLHHECLIFSVLAYPRNCLNTMIYLALPKQTCIV